jgi:hypothetical protein
MLCVSPGVLDALAAVVEFCTPNKLGMSSLVCCSVFCCAVLIAMLCVSPGVFDALAAAVEFCTPNKLVAREAGAVDVASSLLLLVAEVSWHGAVCCFDACIHHESCLPAIRPWCTNCALNTDGMQVMQLPRTHACAHSHSFIHS